jgi:uncharacterized protein YceK
MFLRWRMAMLFVVLSLAGCASVATGPGKAPNAPYQLSNGKQSGPRIGMEKGPLTGIGAGLSR